MVNAAHGTIPGLMTVPPALFRKAVLEQFLEGYASDVALYCEAQGIDGIAYRDGLFGSLGAACPSGGRAASAVRGSDA